MVPSLGISQPSPSSRCSLHPVLATISSYYHLSSHLRNHHNSRRSYLAKFSIAFVLSCQTSKVILMEGLSILLGPQILILEIMAFGIMANISPNHADLVHPPVLSCQTPASWIRLFGLLLYYWNHGIILEIIKTLGDLITIQNNTVILLNSSRRQ